MLDIDQLIENIPSSVNREEQQKVLEANIIIVKSILVDLIEFHTPIIGYRDIIGTIEVRGVGATDPTWAQILSSTFYDYKFAIDDICWINFHIPHDYIPGEDFFIHAHWLSDGTDVNSVKWEFIYTHAKAHDQANYNFTGTTITAEEAPPGSAGRHMLTETVAINIPEMEPDSIFKMRVRRITNGVTDNTDDIFLLTSDLHYLSDNKATINKQPDFYS